ncbi:MAG: TIGR04211 family SH3 domain-containing protein [Gammaproteobacteria bacterium]|nr:TIGR04211 family SH3 domain-containing protein [Gammaproteobacteria bacterium]
MERTYIKRLVFWLLFIAPVMGLAETAYIADKLMVGLHQDKTVDSAIIKVLPSGTPLEVLTRDGELTQVKEPDGVSGWIDNNYLINTPPAQTQLQQVEARANKLEAELKNAKLKLAGLETAENPPNTEDEDKLTAALEENEELKQLFKSERIKVGELQANITELRNSLGQSNDNTALQEKLEQLTEEKAALEKELNNIKTTASASTGSMSINLGNFDWRTILISIATTLIIGFIAGIYVLDVFNRRRHGGFRI